jgi:hypothetical protein
MSALPPNAEIQRIRGLKCLDDEITTIVAGWRFRRRHMRCIAKLAQAACLSDDPTRFAFW